MVRNKKTYNVNNVSEINLNSRKVKLTTSDFYFKKFIKPSDENNYNSTENIRQIIKI